MDIATIAGIISGLALIAIAILHGGGASTFFNLPSAMIVFGGTIGATLINFPLSDVLGVLKTVKNAFLHKAVPPTEIIQNIVHFAQVARKDGILALESRAPQAGDEFLERGILLAVDGISPELIKDIMTTELVFVEDRHGLGQGIFNSMGTYAPAFGLIGTLIGLIQMLGQMSTPERIGPGMAVALITTFYGAVLANLVCLPIAGKLKVRTKMEVLTKEVIIEGILSIQAGDNPRVVEQKLKAFLAPRLRDEIQIRRG